MISKIFTVFPGTDEPRPEYVQRMAANAKLCASAGIPWEVLRPELRPDSHGKLCPVYTSDTVRFEHGAAHPDSLFVCCDYELLYIPELDPAYAYLSPHRDRSELGCIDAIYFGGGQGYGHIRVPTGDGKSKRQLCSFAEMVIHGKKQRGIQDVIGWPTKVLRDSRILSGVRLLPADCFIHDHCRCKDKAAERAAK
jgi:hypothetical protein